MCAKENEHRRVRLVRLSPVISLHLVVAKLWKKSPNSLFSCISPDSKPIKHQIVAKMVRI